ncbi:MAG: serine protease, partial [Aureliella sp.]
YLPRAELRRRLTGSVLPGAVASTLAPKPVAPPLVVPPSVSRLPADEPTQDSAVELDSVRVHPLPEGLVSFSDSPQTLAATVQIQVDFGDSKSVGTGTIIHTAGDQALVLTCAHLFHNRNSAATITVELFGQGGIVREPAIVVDVREEKVGLALIRFRSSAPLAKVPVLRKGEQLQEHDRLFSIASNAAAAGAPVQGRSGGGLFDAQGRLVGVCYAADNERTEGLYIGTEAIYAELEKFHLNWLIEAKNVTPKNSIGQAK